VIIQTADDDDQPSTAQCAEFSFVLRAVASCLESGSQSLPAYIRELKLLLRKDGVSELPRSIVDPMAIQRLLFPELMSSTNVALLPELFDVFATTNRVFGLPRPWEVLAVCDPPVADRLRRLIDLRHVELVAAIVRFLACLVDGDPASSSAVLSVIDFDQLTDLTGSFHFGLWEAVSQLVAQLVTCGVPPEHAVKVVSFCCDALEAAYFGIIHNMLCAIATVLQRNPSVAIEVVNGVPKLPAQLHRHSGNDNFETRKAILIIFGYIAIGNAPLDTFNLNIAVGALSDPNDEVRSLAVWAITNIIAVRDSVNEALEVTRRLCQMADDDSYCVCCEIRAMLPKIITNSIPSHAYRALVAQQRVFATIVRLVDCDEAELRAHLTGLLLLINKLFTVAAAEGWIDSCTEMFEEDDGHTMVEMLAPIELHEDVRARVDEFIARLNLYREERAEQPREAPVEPFE
jgi:hypothetical protein